MTRKSIILVIVVGFMLFISGCKKDNNQSLPFVGDESDMLSYYDIYPEEYFPSDLGISDDVMNGRFPPDIVGEYEMYLTTINNTYKYYNIYTHDYQPLPSEINLDKYMYIIIEDQVNARAKIRFAFKTNNEYNDWYESDAYIYGNVYDGYSFMLCYENTENAGICKYFRGNIITGTIGEDGISNVRYWSVIKDREFSALTHGIFDVGGYEYKKSDFAERISN